MTRGGGRDGLTDGFRRSPLDSFLSYDAPMAGATALTVAGLDHLSGLLRLWIAHASAAKELQALALLTLACFPLALLLGVAARLLTRASAPAEPPRHMAPVAVALPAAYALDFLLGALGGAQPSLSVSILVVVGASLLLTVLLARAWRNATLLPERIHRLALVSAVSLAALTVGLWRLRNAVPPADQIRGTLPVISVTAVLCVLVALAVRGAWSAWVRGLVLFVLLPLAASFAWTSRPLPRYSASAAALPKGVSRVLLITIDTLRADSLGAYGPRGTATPRIDSLAATGLRFSRATAPSSWTLPSITSLMTGASAPAHRTTENESIVPEELTTLAEHLRAAGFVTGAFGVNAYLTGLRGISQGFDHYEVYPLPEYPWDNLAGRLRDRVRPLDYLGHVRSDRLTDLALRWIDRHRDEPFFLWCHYFDPHVPYAPPPEFLPDLPPVESIGTRFEAARPVRAGRLLLNADEKEWIRQLYLAEVRFVDHEVGRLLDAVAQLDRPEETLIILTSDHGEEFWEHGAYEHGHALYQEVLQVPLILNQPGRIVPGVIDTVISGTSLLPTLLEHLRLPYDPADFSAPALSLDPLRPPDDAPVHSAGILHGPEGQAVIHKGWKLIRREHLRDPELFHLEEDPAERFDEFASRPLQAAELETQYQAGLHHAEYLRNRLGIGAGASLELPEDTLEHLRDLGYID